MNINKALKKLRRKSIKTLPCPFCGKIPKIKYEIEEMSSRGSIRHTFSREACCNATGLGQTELFFTNNFKKRDVRLWKSMVTRALDDWNKRTPTESETP